MQLSQSLLRATRRVALAVLAACVQPVLAATFPDLYTVTVPPDRTAADQRAAAEQAAMARLLIRVTGNRNAPLEPALQPLVASPREYLSSYGLDRQSRALVGFSRSQVERALNGLGMPVWGPERPLTLLWVAIDDGAGGRALLGANVGAEPGAEVTPTLAALTAAVRAEIELAADERGLPIAWPLLDLQDLSAVSFEDVWGRFDDQILAASARYRADAVLIGRVRPGTLGNEVEWLFVNGTERQGLPGAAVRDGLDAAADRYAAELSTVGGPSTSAITVRNVATSADYGRVMSYLEQQSVLQRVDVESFGNGTLSLRVAARGDARVLERVRGLGGVLRPAASSSAQGLLVFEFVGSGAPQ
jgi:hypothetical protein